MARNASAAAGPFAARVAPSRHVDDVRLRAVALALLLAFTSLPAAAARFAPEGGRGDRAEDITCPPGHVLSGFFGRTGDWIDQIGLICSAVKPDFTLGAPVRSDAKGGGGGAPTEMECDADGGIRSIGFVHWPAYVPSGDVGKKVRFVQFSCQRPRDGAEAGRAWFGGSHVLGTRTLDGGLQHACPGSEYATGLAVRYGRDVNAIGLICARVVAASAPFEGAWKAAKELGSASAPADESMQPGTDRPGSDYDRFNTDDAEGCRKECQYQSDRCRAWTFVRPGVQGPRGVCYLKNAVPAPQANDCCVSGVPRKVVQLGKRRPSDPTLENGVDRPGSDVHRFVLDAADPKVCQARCERLDRCSAWTFVRPGIQDARAVCYLKDAVPAPVPNACCVSGVKSANGGEP